MKILPLSLGILALIGGCKSRESPREAAPQDLLASIPDRGDFHLDARQASRFAALSLACIDREYPNKPGNVVDGDVTVRPPRELTPVFFGCFDWHSAVHGHWALARVLRRFPDLTQAREIRQRFDAHFTQDKLLQELAYFRAEHNQLFERPYGWGWLLRLAAELHALDDEDARRWHRALEPLARHLAGSSIDYLDRLSVPVRAGTHNNTAFAMVHMLDYARRTGDGRLAGAVQRRARDFFLADRDCPTEYEPSGEDFISPCLVEADLMRRVLPAKEFVTWLDGFLPPPASPGFRPLLTPIEIRDIRDPKIGHLVGLALQRAWCFEGITGALPGDDPRRPVFSRLASLHRHDALRQMFDSGYGGEHWLASFAIYLLTGAGP